MFTIPVTIADSPPQHLCILYTAVQAALTESRKLAPHNSCSHTSSSLPPSSFPDLERLPVNSSFTNVALLDRLCPFPCECNSLLFADLLKLPDSCNNMPLTVWLDTAWLCTQSTAWGQDRLLIRELRLTRLWCISAMQAVLLVNQHFPP